MSTLNLDAIRSRAAQTLDWISRDPCNSDGFRPLSVREHFDHDVPALVAEVERVTAARDRYVADVAHLREQLRDANLTIRAFARYGEEAGRCEHC